jgi:tetratricopeptide (TPR) repeat protein
MTSQAAQPTPVGTASEATTPVEFSNQTKAAMKYKDEGGDLLKEGQLGKAIFKYQLCRMNTQQAALEKTKAEVALEQQQAAAAATRRKAQPEAGAEGETHGHSHSHDGHGHSHGDTPCSGDHGAAASTPPQSDDPMANIMGAFGGGGGSHSDEEILASRTLYLASLNNITHCFIQKGDFGKAIETATDAIRFDPNCGKAYYRRGVAWVMKGNASKGIADLEHALKLSPGDAAVLEKLGWAKERLEAENRTEKAVFSKLFA